MINVVIPKPDYVANGVEGYKELPKKEGGYYIIFDENRRALYVGSTQDLRLRVYQHFKGVSNLTTYTHLFSYCEAFIEKDKVLREMHEFYIMNRWDVPLNIAQKRGFIGSNDLRVMNKQTSARCNGKKRNGKDCANYTHQNGYCHLHGGNGISKRAIIDKAISEVMEKGVL